MPFAKQVFTLLTNWSYLASALNGAIILGVFAFFSAALEQVM